MVMAAAASSGESARPSDDKKLQFPHLQLEGDRQCGEREHTHHHHSRVRVRPCWRRGAEIASRISSSVVGTGINEASREMTDTEQQRQQQRTKQINWNTASPVWFDENAFDPSNADFSVDSYADDLLRYVPLDTLRARLLEYAEEMPSKLVQLVNEDYDEFANLSRRLVSVDQAIQELEAPLGAAQADIEQVRIKLLGHSTSLKEAMRRRQHVSELRNSLELRKSAAQSLANVEGLVRSLEADREGPKKQQQPVEELCKNLDRVCGELGRLLYVLRVNEVDTDMDTSQAEALKATIEAKLESALVTVLDEQDPSAFGTLLHAFSTIGCTETAERVVRRHTISDAVRRATSTITTTTATMATMATMARTASSPSEMLERIRAVLKRDVWQFLEAATSMCGSALPFDFVGGSVLPEVVAALEARFPTMYSPGNPAEFHQTYTALDAFIVDDLESLCTSKDQLARFKGSAARRANRSKWNVAAYFSLRFQDIASAYENSLPNAQTFLSSSGGAARGGSTGVSGENADIAEPIASCVATMRSCMASDVFLPPIADRLIRLQLLVFGRFIDWVGEVARGAEADSGVDPNALALLYTQLTSMNATVVLKEDVRRTIADVNVAEMVCGAYRESEALLLAKAKGLLDIIASGIASTCVECLGQIRGILAALRMTSRTPTAASHYASAILQPLHQFFDANGSLGGGDSVEGRSEIKSTICKDVVSKVAIQFRVVAQETLLTATRTEESLKKLRSRKDKEKEREKEKEKEKDEQDDGTSSKVSRMMAAQLRLDIEEFVRRASELVDDVDSLRETADLIAVVRPYA